jgi:hypothetical protein
MKGAGEKNVLSYLKKQSEIFLKYASMFSCILYNRIFRWIPYIFVLQIKDFSVQRTFEVSFSAVNKFLNFEIKNKF